MPSSTEGENLRQKCHQARLHGGITALVSLGNDVISPLRALLRERLYFYA